MNVTFQFQNGNPFILNCLVFLKGFVFLSFNEVRQYHTVQYCLICTSTDYSENLSYQRVFQNIYGPCPKSFGLIQVFLWPHETADRLITEMHSACFMRKHHDLGLCCHVNRNLYSILYLWSPSNDWHLYTLFLTFYLTKKNLIDSFNTKSIFFFWSTCW